MASLRQWGLLVLAVATLAAPGGAETTRTEFGDPDFPMYVAWFRNELVVQVSPRPNEGYLHLARRVMADPERYREIVRYNRGRPVRLGQPVMFPLAALKPELRGWALRALFPHDELTGRGWLHRVVSPYENLIQLSLAFTGTRRHYRQLARLNGLSSPDLLREGMELLIPRRWIPDALELRPLAVRSPLGLEREEGTGRYYATYTIRPSETLYSSVLLRFTDRERAAEVRRLARRLVRINGLDDASHVPAGRTLRIPLEWIGEDYLAGSEARELEPPRRPGPKRASRRAPARLAHVIIDPGHGGVDPGAVYGGRAQGTRVYEDEVVYDIALRLGRQLRGHGHPVYFTVRDPDRRRPVARLARRSGADKRVLVTPPYRIDSHKVGINMRVYRIESLYRELTGRGVDPENIVLVSIHGDALAPQLRGAMAYYPDPRLRYDTFQPQGRVYRLREEAIPAYIHYRDEANRTAAALSERFAHALIDALDERGVGVSRRRPVRPYYYRDGERTLPGVLRYSRVPTSVLVEVSNLNNRADRRAILEPDTRERIANGIALAIDRLPASRSLVASAGGG